MRIIEIEHQFNACKKNDQIKQCLKLFVRKQKEVK